MSYKRYCDRCEAEMQLADIQIPDQQTKGDITTLGAIKITITGQLDLCQECILEKIDSYIKNQDQDNDDDCEEIDL